jgi:predicted phosphoribosyltransferase
MERRIEKYKSGSFVHGVQPDTVIVVDDGIATGKTAAAALLSARASYPSAKLIFAAPVGAPDSVAELRAYTDEIVCLKTPPDFGAVGEWYEYFPQISDAEVIECLEKTSKSKD